MFYRFLYILYICTLSSSKYLMKNKNNFPQCPLKYDEIFHPKFLLRDTKPFHQWQRLPSMNKRACSKIPPHLNTNTLACNITVSFVWTSNLTAAAVKSALEWNWVGLSSCGWMNGVIVTVLVAVWIFFCHFSASLNCFWQFYKWNETNVTVIYT